MKKWYIIFLGIYLSLLSGQTSVAIHGFISEESSGEPIAGVDVWIEETGWHTISDEDGTFRFPRMQSGFYTLHFYRIGYQSQKYSVHITPENAVSLRIKLRPQQIIGDTVVVIDKTERFQISEAGKKLVLKLDSLQITGHSILNALEQIPGLTLMKDDMGKVRVLFHGTMMGFIKVMVDGIDISDPQTGEVDLSVVSEDQIERVEVYSVGNSGEFGSQAIGGVINLITRSDPENQLRGAFSYGSFKYKRGQFSLSRAFDQERTIHISYAYSDSKNDFKYTYMGNSYTRKNNSYIDRIAAIKLNNWLNPIHSEKLESSHFFQFMHKNHHMPGNYYYGYQPIHAFSIEDMVLGGSHITYKIFPNLILENQFQWKKYSGEFDGHEENAFRFWTVNQNLRLENQLSLKFKAGNHLISRTRFGWLEEKIKVEDRLNPFASIEPATRVLRDVAQNINLFWKAVKSEHYFTSSVRFQEYKTRWTPYYFFEWNMLTSFRWISLHTTITYGENFKIPDLNSLFWVSSATALGNPDLLPEEGISRQVQVNLDFHSLPFSINWSYYYNTIHNYIFWQPDFRGVWKPSNLGRMQLQGYNINVQVKTSLININYDYYLQHPRNYTPGHVSYGKIIPYVFLFQHKLQLKLNYRGVAGVINGRWNSERESLIANSEGTQIPAFKVLDFQLQMSKKWKFARMGLTLEMNNIFNERYDLILGYPMPGRHFILTCWIKS